MMRMEVVSLMSENDVMALYGAVFGTDHSVKPCGREVCKRLIDALQKDAASRDLSENFDFGDVDTGVMNLVTVQYYVSEFFS